LNRVRTCENQRQLCGGQNSSFKEGYNAAALVRVHTGAGVLLHGHILSVSLRFVLLRRRLRRLAASGEGGLPTAGHCHKPTPQDVITSLPVIRYADAVKQLEAGHRCSSQGKQRSSKPVAAAAAAVAADTLQPQDQQQLDIEGQGDQRQPQAAAAEAAMATQEQQTSDLRKSSAFSLSGADAASAAAGRSVPSVQPLTGSNEAECCPICFGEYDSAAVRVRQLPCRHYFHPECIDAWLVRDSTCPLCKSLVWVRDDTPAAAAAVAVAGQQQQQQRQGHRQLLRVIVIGGPLPRQQQL
jgi:hypothetical protein